MAYRVVYSDIVTTLHASYGLYSISVPVLVFKMTRTFRMRKTLILQSVPVLSVTLTCFVLLP